MHGADFFFQAFVYLSAAVISVPIAKRLGLGSVLGYLLAGVAIGPWGLELVGQEGQDVMHYAEFGVVMMLFLVGLELRPSLLWRMKGPILGMGGAQVASTTAVVTAVALLFGLPWQTALAVGMTLALSSTAIALQTLDEKGLLKTEGGQSSFAVLLFQDIAVIPMLALLPMLALTPPQAVAAAGAPHAAIWVEGLPGWARTLAVLGSVGLIVVVGRFVLRHALRAIARTGMRELFTAAALLLIIAIALLMTQVGLSPALGTFLAGVVLGNSEYRHELEGDIEPFKGLLLGLFFISVGACIDFGLVLSQPGLIVGLVLALVVGKLLILVGVARAFRMSLSQNLLLACTLAQGGEFAFVLVSFASQQRVLPAEVSGPIIAVVALSMALSPLLMILWERVLRPLAEGRGAQRPDDPIDEQHRVLVAGFGRFGAIVGRLLRANGVPATVLDLDPDNVEVLRRLGLKVFYGDAARPDLLRAAGAAQAKLLVVATDEPERTAAVVAAAQKHFPHLQILARARSRMEAYELHDAGVSHVYRECLDSALALGVDALRHAGLRGHQAVRAARTFRRHDEQCVTELAALRHDRTAYLNLARERIHELERILLDELQDAGEHRDMGWDTTTLREEFGALPTPPQAPPDEDAPGSESGAAGTPGVAPDATGLPPPPPAPPAAAPAEDDEAPPAAAPTEDDEAPQSAAPAEHEEVAPSAAPADDDGAAPTPA